MVLGLDRVLSDDGQLISPSYPKLSCGMVASQWIMHFHRDPEKYFDVTVNGASMPKAS